MSVLPPGLLQWHPDFGALPKEQQEAMLEASRLKWHDEVSQRVRDLPGYLYRRMASIDEQIRKLDAETKEPKGTP
jgi:hypothetical protein